MNLGHIYLIQELFAFHFVGEVKQIPENFNRLFAMGTKPADWNEEPPTLDVLTEMLEAQPQRIQEVLEHRLDEQLKTPFKLGGGALTTVREILSFSLYHEGRHYNTITLLKRFVGESV